MSQAAPHMDTTRALVTMGPQAAPNPAALRALVANLGRPRTVLDVGSGGGRIGAAARRTGARVTGVESASASIDEARRVLDEVVAADLDSDASVRAALEGRRFDRILVAGALDRAADPRALITRFVPYLEDDGHVSAAIDRLRYNAESAARLCESAGLEVLRVEEPLFGSHAIVIARQPPRPRRLSLTVGMLTMDEEESIEAMIGEIRRVAPDGKILCVDSSMHDRTPEIARSLGARVIRQVPPRGHGPAMERLMYAAAAESELLVYIDCDFTYPVETIPVVRRLIEDEGVDVVNCARTRTRPAAMPVPNYLANRAFAAMAHALHGVPTCDVHSGMRAYRTGVVRAFDFDGEGDALPIDTLLYPAKCGYRVVEMPIDYNERVGTSKLRKLAGTVWTMIRLGRALPVGQRRGERFELR